MCNKIHVKWYSHITLPKELQRFFRVVEVYKHFTPNGVKRPRTGFPKS